MTQAEFPHGRRRGNQFYGRRKGRTMRSSRAEALTNLPEYGLQLPAAEQRFEVEQLIGEGGMFGEAKRDLWLEIGFGNGEHTVHIAEQYPDVGIIGFEPFLNGVAYLLREVHRRDVTNIRVFNDDARLLLPCLPPESVGRIYVQFPDPWPKTRHHRRRIIQTAMLDRFALLLRPGGELRLASDDPGMIEWMMEKTWRHPKFQWQATKPEDWRIPPADWTPTRYYSKAIADGRSAYFLNFTRI